MDERKQSWRRGRFNVIDFVIFFLILAVIAVIVYMLFFSSFNIIDKIRNKGNEKDVLYRFELVVDADLVDAAGKINMASGESFADAEKDYEIGKVYGISDIKPYRRLSQNDYEYHDSVLYKTVTVTVKAKAYKNSDGTYAVNGSIIRIGDGIVFGTPYFSGSAKCVSISEVTANG